MSERGWFRPSITDAELLQVHAELTAVCRKLPCLSDQKPVPYWADGFAERQERARRQWGAHSMNIWKRQT